MFKPTLKYRYIYIYIDIEMYVCNVCIFMYFKYII